MAAKPLVSRGKGLSDRPQTCGLRARFPDCLSTHRFAGFDGQQSGRECIFLFRTDPQFSMVVPLRSQARLWLSLLHWAYYGLFPPLAAAFVRPCASLARCSVSSHRPRLTAARCSGAADALWACPRASSRFAAFDCALRVLGTSALRAFTFLQAFAPEKYQK